MKNNTFLLIAMFLLFLLSVGFIYNVTIYHQQSYTNYFEERVTNLAQKVLSSNAELTVKHEVDVYQYEELKKPYLDKLAVYYEAALYNIIATNSWIIFNVYSELDRANSKGDIWPPLVINELVRINRRYQTYSIGAMAGDSNYINFEKYQIKKLKERLLEFDTIGKPLKCLIAEAKTLSAKIRRGMYDEVLYTNYQIYIEVPINSKVSYFDEIQVTEYLAAEDNVKSLEVAKIEFLKILPKIEEFRKEYNCN